MTSNMRDVLSEASKNALRRVHDTQGAPDWPAPANTLRALQRHGFVEYVELTSRKGHRVEIWSCTELGREALKAPQWSGEEKPQYLTDGAIRYRKLPNNRWRVVEDDEGNGNYTTDPGRSRDWDPVMGALPTVDADRLSVKWRRVSALERVGAQESRDAAGRVARSLRAA